MLFNLYEKQKNVEKHFYTKKKNKIASAHVNAPITLK